MMASTSSKAIEPMPCYNLKISLPIFNAPPNSLINSTASPKVKM
jgi:hypothetical protein